MSCEPRPAGGLRLAVCGVCGGDMGGDRCVCGAHVLVGRQRTRLPAPRNAHGGCTGVVRWSGGANGRIQIPRVHAVLVSRVGKSHRAHDDTSLLSLEVLHTRGARVISRPPGSPQGDARPTPGRSSPHWQRPRGEHAAPRLRARPGAARHGGWLEESPVRHAMYARRAAVRGSGESPEPRAWPVAFELSPPKGRAVARDGERARARAWAS